MNPRIRPAADFMWFYKGDRKFEISGVARIYQVDAKELQKELCDRVIEDLKARIAKREQENENSQTHIST